ncbi:hypothetical protein PU629_14755 [Pullulanibacillus sp. KACC 23026]|uniref:hypothetical protein n=1 Tax=Pullulanibacillus sp. KACC 23026 TaxID=3028315 RepID=UPI0023B0B883|nr:hypothetical protein [Pullulanibacillus sp. KACC 23026]WEG11416.1 hypothetical protein PU629_14755 [Pullulanibacillus sp. KACC 23026]
MNEQDMKTLKMRLDELEKMIKDMKDKGRSYYINIEHAEIQGPIVDKLDYNFDKLDIKEVSGALNLGNNFGVRVGKLTKKDGKESTEGAHTESEWTSKVEKERGESSQPGTESNSSSIKKSEGSSPSSEPNSSETISKSAHFSQSHSDTSQEINGSSANGTHKGESSSSEVPISHNSERAVVEEPSKRPNSQAASPFSEKKEELTSSKSSILGKTVPEAGSREFSPNERTEKPNTEVKGHEGSTHFKRNEETSSSLNLRNKNTYALNKKEKEPRKLLTNKKPEPIKVEKTNQQSLGSPFPTMEKGEVLIRTKTGFSIKKY